jgi:cytochrome P450
MVPHIATPPFSVDIDDPAFYRGDVQAVYRWLRAEAPVYWHERCQCWIVSKYEDVRFVSSHPDLFTIEAGIVLGQQTAALQAPDPLPDEMEARLGHELPRTAEVRRLYLLMTNPDPDAPSLLNIDPPRHTKLRNLFLKAFTPKVVGPLEDHVTRITTEALDAVEPGEVVDFVEALAAPVPMLVIAALLGVSGPELAQFRRWSDTLVKVQLPNPTPEEVHEITETMGEFLEYFRAQLEQKRSDPGDDLLSMMTQAEIDGERLAPALQESLAFQLLLAGNETTRNVISGGAWALAERPDQRQLLVDEPDLLPSAADELIRWVTPVMNFARTAKVPVELRGQRIAAGDYVVMLYSSANRDEEVWEHADRLDVTRPARPMHVAFGHGAHYCLGQSIARMEVRVVFRELLARFPNYELAGEVRALDWTNLFNAIDTMPVRFA